MTEKTKPTPFGSADIRAQLVALDTTLEDLREEAVALSLDAVGGDRPAAERLAAINLEIDRVKGDRRILADALGEARLREKQVHEQSDAHAKAQALDDARQHALALQETARKVDQTLADLHAALVELDTQEAAIRSALSRARVTAPGSIIGRRDLSGFALNFINLLGSGRSKFTKTRPLSEIAEVAWAFLFDETTDEVA